MHEDLVKWRDEYLAARVNIDEKAHYDVPAPTSNVLLDNLKLSFVKYFRASSKLSIVFWGFV